MYYGNCTTHSTILAQTRKELKFEYNNDLSYKSFTIVEARLHVPSKSPFCTVLKLVQCIPMVLFTVKKVKGAALKNGEVDGICK